MSMDFFRLFCNLVMSLAYHSSCSSKCVAPYYCTFNLSRQAHRQCDQVEGLLEEQRAALAAASPSCKRPAGGQSSLFLGSMCIHVWFIVPTYMIQSIFFCGKCEVRIHIPYIVWRIFWINIKTCSFFTKCPVDRCVISCFPDPLEGGFPGGWDP